MIASRRRWVLVVAIGVVVTACASDDGDRAGTPVETPTATTVGSPNERGGPVDLGAGRTIHLQCEGSGQPTVVLVSGLGDGADVWSVPPDPEPQGPTVHLVTALEMWRRWALGESIPAVELAEGLASLRDAAVNDPTGQLCTVCVLVDTISPVAVTAVQPTHVPTHRRAGPSLSL